MDGAEIKRIRKLRGFSRRDFALHLGTTYESLCRWENGNRSPSKYFEALISRLDTGLASDLSRATWVISLGESKRICDLVNAHNKRVLGVVRGCCDASRRIVVVQLTQIEGCTEILGLQDAIADLRRNDSQGELPVIGCMVAETGLSRPTENIAAAMQYVRSLTGTGYAILLNAKTNGGTVWALSSEEQRSAYGEKKYLPLESVAVAGRFIPV